MDMLMTALGNIILAAIVAAALWAAVEIALSFKPSVLWATIKVGFAPPTMADIRAWVRAWVTGLSVLGIVSWYLGLMIAVPAAAVCIIDLLPDALLAAIIAAAFVYYLATDLRDWWHRGCSCSDKR